MSVELETKIVTAICEALGESVAGGPLTDSAAFRNALVGLEHYIPAVLREAYSEWGRESLDGIMPAVARKVSPNELELFGDAYLISDQSVVPLYLQLQIDSRTNEIVWFECRLGERGAHGLKRTPYNSGGAVVHRLLPAGGNQHPAHWMYHVAFGERRAVS